MRKIDWEKYTSSEFLLAIGAMIAGWLTYFATNVDPEFAVYLTAGAAVVYALSRGLAKYNNDLKSGYKTREFWLAIAGMIIVVLAAIPGVISPELAVASSATIFASYGLSRGMAKSPLDEVTGSGDEMYDM